MKKLMGLEIVNEDLLHIFSQLVERLPKTSLIKAYEAAKALKNEDARLYAIFALAAHLPNSLQFEIIQKIRETATLEDSSKLLATLANSLQGEARTEILKDLWRGYEQLELNDIWPRLELLKILLPYLRSTRSRLEGYTELLRLGYKQNDGSVEGQACAFLSTFLPRELPDSGGNRDGWRTPAEVKICVDAIREAFPGLLDDVIEESPEWLAKDMLNAKQALRNAQDKARIAILWQKQRQLGIAPPASFRPQLFSNFGPELVLENLLLKLPPDHKQTAISEAFRTILRLQVFEWTRDVLWLLSQQMSGEIAIKLLSDVNEVHDDWMRAYALSALAPQVPQYAVDMLWHSARTLNESNPHAWLLFLSASFDRLEGVRILEAWQCVKGIGMDSVCTLAIACIFVQLPDSLKAEAKAVCHVDGKLSKLFESDLKKISDLAESFTQLPHNLIAEKAPDLSNDWQWRERFIDRDYQLEQSSWKWAKQEWNEVLRLATISNKLEPRLRDRALSRLLDVTSWLLTRKAYPTHEGIDALMAISWALPHNHRFIIRTWNLTQKFKGDVWCLLVWCQLAIKMPDKQKFPAIKKILPQVLKLSSSYSREKMIVLFILTPHLDKSEFQDARRIAESIEWHDPERAYALAVLTSHVPDWLQAEVWKAAWDSTGYIGKDVITVVRAVLAAYMPQETYSNDEFINMLAADELASLSPFLDKSLWSLLNRLKDEEILYKALCLLVDRLNEAEIVEAWSMTYGNVEPKDSTVRARALCALAPYFRDEGRNDALLKALRVTTNLPLRDRAELISQLAVRCPTSLYDEIKLILSQALQDFDLSKVFFGMKDGRPQLLVYLGLLVPAIAHVGGDGSIEKILRAQRDVTRWWP